jgi:hypothetical protein
VPAVSNYVVMRDVTSFGEASCLLRVLHASQMRLTAVVMAGG